MKKHLREIWQTKRREISSQRRQEAEHHFLQAFTDDFSHYTYILSFASLSSEFPTHALNAFLADKGKLLLPRMEKNQLGIYHVECPASQLTLNAWGIWEPYNCRPAERAHINLILVPGLAFDTAFHRLGYGKGFYDRLLPSLSAPSLGLGFQEQLSSTLLPVEAHDHALSGLRLY